MATPTRVEALGVSGTGTVQVVTAAGTQVGDVLIAIRQTAFRPLTDLTAPTGTAGTWTQFAQAESSGTGTVRLRAWWRRVTASGAQTVTASVSGSNTNSLVVLVLRGCESTASPIDGTPTTANGATSGAETLPEVDPGSNDSLLIGTWGAYGGGIGANTYAPPSGMSDTPPNGIENKIPSSDNNAHMVASQVLANGNPTGVRTPGLNGSTPSSWAGILFAVRGPLVTTTTRRLYLTNSAPPVTPGTSYSAWNDTAARDTPSRLGTSPRGAVTSYSRTETSTNSTDYDVLLGQWVSGPISVAGTFQETTSFTVAIQQSDAAADLRPLIILWVRAPDGSSRGNVVNAVWDPPTELPTTATAVTRSPGTALISAQPGDRIVLELGYRAGNAVATPYTGTIWYGGIGTPDLANGGADLTKPAWVDVTVPNTITFLPDPPIVDAGADVASHTVGTLFSRTATEVTTGDATVTSRAWTIQSGPAGVGTTIGTAAALSWTPATIGTYVLRYVATNSAGPSSPDTITVKVTGVPVTANAGAGDAAVEGLTVESRNVVGARPGVGEVTTEGLLVVLAHIVTPFEEPPAFEVEGLPVQVSHVVHVAPGAVAVAGQPVRAAGTGINPGDLVVEGTPIQVSYVTSGTSGLGGVVAVPPAPATRFIAQAIIGKQFLSWDLPLVEPDITLALSGPTVIRGRLEPESVEERDLLAAGLQAWGCWLHVETDGEIRASGILQPFPVDGETVDIEALGVSAYPHGLPYLEELAAIDADPADIVRAIWTSLSNYPDGNLGVTITGATPVRVGEPEPEEGVEYEEGERPAGPYKLAWWDAPDCGSEIDNLAREVPFDYIERFRWNDDRTAVLHWIDLYYPRAGARTNARFADGENILSAAPAEEPDDLYASQVLVLGRGEGRDMIRGYAGRPIPGRLRRVAVVQDGTIATVERANAIAAAELERRQALVDVTDLEVDARHNNARFGSYSVGDDVLVDVEVPWLGRLRQYERVLSITYSPDSESVRLQLRRAEAFRDGGVVA